MRIQNNNPYLSTPSYTKNKLESERNEIKARLYKDNQALAQNTSKRITQEAKITLQMGEQAPAKQDSNSPDYDGVKDPLLKAKEDFKEKKEAKDKQDSFKYQEMDTRVRAHEAAHLAAAGGEAAGGASFSYTKGPDGKMYASAGEVPVALSKGQTPQESIQKAASVMAAALAPADPSSQDLRVASQAARMQTQARSELLKQKESENKENEEDAKKLQAQNEQNNPDKKDDKSISGLKPLDEKALKTYTARENTLGEYMLARA